MLLRKETPGPGVLPPEALPPDPFIKDMESQGSLLTVEESEDLYR
jgi:saccharopine dehydrogenase-like NADP-dependent oxidoreductase